MTTDKDKTASVYALVDPTDMTVRYIGVSTNIQKRLKEHLREAQGCFSAIRSRAGISTLPVEYLVSGDRSKWLGELLARGLEPLLVTLAVLPEADAREAEKEFIGVFAAHTPLYQSRDTGIVYSALRDDSKTVPA